MFLKIFGVCFGLLGLRFFNLKFWYLIHDCHYEILRVKMGHSSKKKDFYWFLPTVCWVLVSSFTKDRWKRKHRMSIPKICFASASSIHRLMVSLFVFGWVFFRPEQAFTRGRKVQMSIMLKRIEHEGWGWDYQHVVWGPGLGQMVPITVRRKKHRWVGSLGQWQKGTQDI